MVALATEFADKMAEMGCKGIFLATTAQVDSYTGEQCTMLTKICCVNNGIIDTILDASKKIIGALKK